MSDPATTLYTPLQSVPTAASNGHRDIALGNGELRKGARARYFGPHHRLFGIFDEPDNASDRGVVLCYPHGADYDSAFRSFRILGTRLARAGFHVLRFDYSCTGDSLGDIEDGSIAQWTEDTVAAIHELRASHDVREVGLVGLRLGATVAALAAAQAQVERLVMWQPVIDASEYLIELRGLHQDWIGDEHRHGRAKHADDDDLLGYRLASTMRHELENLSVSSLSGLPAPSVYIVNHTSSVETADFTAWLQSRGANVATTLIDGPTIWSRSPSMPEAAVPSRALQEIVSCVSGYSQ